MIADTTFLVQLLHEDQAESTGPAQRFLAARRREAVRTTIISMAEIAVGFPTSADAWWHFRNWRIYPVHRGVAEAAADVDRQLVRIGQRLGENDNWIAGFCRYYREPVISLDSAFDRVPGLRRLAY
jgi:predicted nucleic acid-binding protein